MDISTLLVLFSSSIIYTNCVKTYRFTSLKACKTDSDEFAEITKCEIDGMYFTLNVHNKAFFKKINVRA